MTQYVRHFLEDTLAAAGQSLIAPGTTALWGGDTTVQSDATVSRYLGDRYLAVLFAVKAGDRIGVTLDSVQADANRGDVEVLTRIHAVGTQPYQVSLGARCSGTSSAWVGYFGEVRRLTAATRTVALVRGGGSPSDNDLATAVLNIADGQTYWIRFRVQAGNLSLRVWTGEISDEPVAWTVTAVDGVPIVGAGAVCIGGKAVSGFAADGTVALFFVSVGTGGDAAPAPPKTRQQYLDLLSTQDCTLCMLAEIDVLGQTASGSSVGRLCMSNIEFTSKPSDRYPNIGYEDVILKAPQIRRRLGNNFVGRSTISYGDLVFKNEVVNSDSATLGESFAGRLDHWLNYNVDGRALRLLLGHPTWRRCDFKTYFLGTLADIYRAGYGQLAFKLRGIESFFSSPVSTALIGGSGPNANALIPIAAHSYFNVEPILYDSNTITYQLELGTYTVFDLDPDRYVYDQGVALQTAKGTILSADAATDVLTSVANHNLVVNDFWEGQGALPGNVPGNTQIYVKSVPTPTTFTLSGTLGGATLDVTSATGGGTFYGRRYSYSAGKLTLNASPAGRVTAKCSSLTTTVFLAQEINYIVSNYSGRATSLPGGAFSQSVYNGNMANGPLMMGYWKQQVSIGSAIDELTISAGASLCFAREGTWYLHQLDVPTGTAVWTVVKDDIRNWRTNIRAVPSNVERLGYQRNYTVMKGGDLAGAVSLPDRDLLGRPYSLATYVPVETGLERPANHLLVDNPPERQTQLLTSAAAATEVQRNYTLYRKRTGTVLFDTGAWALAAELGEECAVTYPRDGFASTKNALIVGAVEDALRGKVELEIFCPFDGVWPFVDTSTLFVSGDYYDGVIGHYVLNEDGTIMIAEDGTRVMQEI